MKHTVTLRNGVQVPAIGLGTWFLGENKAARAREMESLRTGISAGMTLIDTAEMYGNGKAESLIKEVISDKKRDDLFLVSKVLPNNAGKHRLEQALDNSMKRTGGRNRDSIVSDAMESVIGAIYLDGGFASAKEFIHKFILKDIEHKKLFYDSKTILQEIVQSDYKGKEIEYVLTGEIGPDHDKKFVVSLVVGDKTLGEGTGRTKKAAEQEAAYRAIIKLKGNA